MFKTFYSQNVTGTTLFLKTEFRLHWSTRFNSWQRLANLQLTGQFQPTIYFSLRANYDFWILKSLKNKFVTHENYKKFKFQCLWGFIGTVPFTFVWILYVGYMQRWMAKEVGEGEWQTCMVMTLSPTIFTT